MNSRFIQVTAPNGCGRNFRIPAYSWCQLWKIVTNGNPHPYLVGIPLGDVNSTSTRIEDFLVCDPPIEEDSCDPPVEI
jgi:hypothetical protein